MNLEKLRDLIDNLEIESKQKLFIKEIKNTTVNTLILTLKEIYSEFSKLDLAENFQISEDLHVYYKNRYEEALKAIDILEYELDEMKKLHENLKKDNEKKKKKNFDSDSPLIEKNFKSYNMINQIKLECEKNYLNEDEVSVITKKEEQEMKDKIKEFKQSIIHVEREKDDMLKQMEKLENNIHENNLKIEKITKENNILLLKNEDILLENKKILEEKKSLKIELELLRKKNAFFEKQNKSISSKNAGLSTRITTLSQEMEKIQIEKAEIEETYQEKIHLLAFSLEKRKINEKFGEICIKSEDFGSNLQKVSPKIHSYDQTIGKENLMIEPEKLTFRKTNRLSRISNYIDQNEKYSKLNNYKTDFAFYDNKNLLEEIISEKNSIEKKRITLEKEKFTPHYHSDGNEKLNSVSSSAKLPFEKKLFVCSTIFPNDEIKFVCKRKKNNSKLICKNLKINEKIIDSKKVENRSCDPCRIF